MSGARRWFHRDGWPAQAGVALAYALAYLLLHALSVSHWNLPAGLRVACLLLVPRRYWAALVIGEAMPLAWQVWGHHQQFGVAWALLDSVPPILLYLPVFAWCRRRMKVGQAVDMPLLLSAIMLGAMLITLVNTVALAMLHMPDGGPGPAITAPVVFGYFLGNDLGALTLAPALLVLRQWWAGHRGGALLSGRLMGDAGMAALPLLVLLCLARGADADTLEVCRILMCLPVVWLTMRHGWFGAATGGLLASVAVQLSATMVREPAVMQAQALIAFVISTLLMLGARDAQTLRAPEAIAPPSDATRGFQLARQGLYQESLRLREAAESLERIGLSMREGQKRMLDRLRPLLPNNVEHIYTRQLAVTQYEVHRLANALHPRAWRERGLAAMFEDGPLAQAATLAGAGYRFQLCGSGLDDLSPDVPLALYRQACEAMVVMLAREPVRAFHLQLRGGCTHGHRWVAMRMRCERAPLPQRGRPVPEWRQVVSMLGAQGQGMATLHDFVQIYGGVVHQRDTEHRLDIALLLHDVLQPSVVPAMSVQPTRMASAHG